MQKVSDIIKNSSILAIIWIWNWRPVELQQITIFPIINISIIDSFNSLEFYTKNMLKSNLRVRVSKTISCPSDFSLNTKLGMHKVMTNSVLIKNIIKIANSLIILNPPCIRYLQLTVLDQSLHLLSLWLRNVLIPILEKHNLCHKIFSIWLSCQSI